MPRFTAEFARETKYGLLILGALGFITFLYSSDMLFMKRFFDPGQAGLYGGVAAIARIIYFGTLSVSAVLLASVKRSAPAEQNRVLLRNSLLLVIGLGGTATALFALFPHFFIKILIGSSYLPVAHLLPLASLYLFFASLANVLVSYLLALRRLVLLPIGAVSIISVFALAASSRARPEDVVAGFLVASFLTFILLFAAARYPRASRYGPA